MQLLSGDVFLPGWRKTFMLLPLWPSAFNPGLLPHVGWKFGTDISCITFIKLKNCNSKFVGLLPLWVAGPKVTWFNPCRVLMHKNELRNTTFPPKSCRTNQELKDQPFPSERLCITAPPWRQHISGGLGTSTHTPRGLHSSSTLPKLFHDSLKLTCLHFCLLQILSNNFF